MGDSLIIKKTLYPGHSSINFQDGAKVCFHFQTRLADDSKKLIDDSRKMVVGKPFELVLGKKFKLEVWEVIVQKMAVGEVAHFTVDKSLILQYPFVSKTLRDLEIPAEERKSHCCAMTLQTEGVGYEDLNELLKNPVNLEFTIELLKVEQPEDYQKEVWQMSEGERLQLIPELKVKGNSEFSKKNYNLAADHYAKAIGMLEQLMLKEKPHDDEWNLLNKQKVPLLLNFVQCKLYEDEFYVAIEHCTTVLQIEPDNIKALFRRAKAHAAVWNLEEARRDYEEALKLDKTLEDLIKKELQALDNIKKTKDMEDKKKYKYLFTK